MPAKYEYASEAHLCAAFIEWVKAVSGKVDHGHRTPVWTPYAETAGWDILLVADDGAQIGIEAKLNFNMKVLAQAMPENYEAWRETGPDFRAILVPNGDDSHRRICAALGLLIFTPRRGYGNQQVFAARFDAGDRLGSELGQRPPPHVQRLDRFAHQPRRQGLQPHRCERGHHHGITRRLRRSPRARHRE